MPADPNNPFGTDGNEADTESELDEQEQSEIDDEDGDDQELQTKTDQAREGLLAFLKDWLESQQNIVWETIPGDDGKGGVKSKTNEEANPEVYKIYFNIDAILRQALGKASPKIQHYKDLLTRISPWVDKGKTQPGNDYQDSGEISRLEYFITNWKQKAEEQYQDAKDDINNTIDGIKGAIRQHLVNWKEELEPLIPKDQDQKKEDAKNNLINWEIQLIRGLKDWLTANKRYNAEGHEIELSKKEQGLLKGVIKRTENAVKSKKLTEHYKLIGDIRIKLGQIVEETIPEPDEVIPEASKNKELFNTINAGTNLLKNWSEILTGIDKPNPEAENAKKFIKFIDFALIKDKLGVYKQFVEKIKEIKVVDQIKPFEICITGGGIDCDNHPGGGNWLNAWKKALGRLKRIEKEREREKEAKEKAPCDCLHCSHGLGAWTWISCPFYDFSIFKDKELGKLGTIMGPDNAPHWIPPAGWTPFYRPDGNPHESKCNNRVNNKINLAVKWKWEPREEHGGTPKPRGPGNKGKAPEKPIYNFPSASTTHEYEPGPAEDEEETIHI